MNPGKRWNARFSEDATLFIWSSAHLFSSTKTSGKGHVNFLFPVNFLVIGGFCGHIQDQPVRSRSAVRDRMSRFIIDFDIDNTDWDNPVFLIFSPEQ